MADIIFKLRVLRMLLSGTFEEWKRDVWRRDLDDSYCCDGRECGCQACSVRELYSWHIKDHPHVTP